MEEIKHTAEDEFNDIIDRIELRAMACDGPVTPTLKEATEEELSRLWELVNEISPKRKAISRRILQGKETDQDTNDYLVANGLDPEVVGKTGAVFVKAVCENIKLKKENAEALNSYNLECKRNDQLQEEVDKFDNELTNLNRSNEKIIQDWTNESKQQAFIIKSQKEEILLYREALIAGVNYLKFNSKLMSSERVLLSKFESALSKFQPKKDESIK